MATPKTEKNEDTATERGAQPPQSSQSAPSSQSQSSQSSPQPSSPQQRGPGSRALARDQGRSSGLSRSPGSFGSFTSFGPFAIMRRLFADLERLTGFDVPEASGTERRGVEGALFMPTVDVVRRGDRMVVTVDLPGMSADDIEVTVHDDAVIIAGERRIENEQREGDIWSCERSYGRFQRVIALPEGADASTAEARFENGVLEIAVRAPEQGRQGRKIDIKSSATQQSGMQQSGTQQTSH